MIQYSNIKRIENLPFEEYKKLGGYSHSFVKYNESGVPRYIQPTDKMRLGSLVDALLTSSSEFDISDPLADHAMRIASKIKETYASMISNFKPQVSYTGTMEFAGLKMETTGRLDWELPRFNVTDLKVTGAKSDKEFRILIDYMGYENQLWNYAKLGNFSKAYILPFSVPLNKCLRIVSVPILERNKFWEDAILKFGSAA